MSWEKLLESTKESLNDHMRLRNEYLTAENRILRHQIVGQIQLTDSERKELAEIGAKLGKKALAEIATVAQPDTILAWNRKFTNQRVDTAERPRSVGRPRVDPEIEDWVVRMASENPSWGYDRIQGSLQHLCYTISDQTVGNILKRHGISPAPERKKSVTWREFIRSHWAVFVATGFFDSEVWNLFGLSITYLFSLIHSSLYGIQSVQMIVHRQMRVLKDLRQRALDLVFFSHRCTFPVTQRSPVTPAAHTGFEEPWLVFELVDSKLMRTQAMAQVVDLSFARCRQIRDGPRRDSHRRHHQQPEDYRRVA